MEFQVLKKPKSKDVFYSNVHFTLREFELVIGIAEHVSDIHVSTNIQKVKLKNVGQIQKSMGPFKKMPLL